MRRAWKSTTPDSVSYSIPAAFRSTRIMSAVRSGSTNTGFRTTRPDSQAAGEPASAGSSEGRGRGFDKASYRRRNMVERCIGWLKDRRRPATRYEKPVEDFEAMVELAMLERLLKALLPVTP